MSLPPSNVSQWRWLLGLVARALRAGVLRRGQPAGEPVADVAVLARALCAGLRGLALRVDVAGVLRQAPRTERRANF